MVTSKVIKIKVKQIINIHLFLTDITFGQLSSNTNDNVKDNTNDDFVDTNVKMKL